jgi:hypothetical protein
MSTAVTVDYRTRPNCAFAVWANLVASESGLPVEIPEYNDKTVSITGTFGGAVTIEGSNDGTNYVGLKDAITGTAISATSNGIFVIKENARFIRPVAAVGVTGVAVSIVAKKGVR